MSDLELRLLRDCNAGKNIGDSDRANDRARTKLKRLGYLQFNRQSWVWEVTEAGKAVLHA